MEYPDFVRSMGTTLDGMTYQNLREMLIGEYLSFAILSQTEITPPILAEKICDYFEKLELKTGRNFPKVLDFYFEQIEKMVEPYIMKTPRSAKGNAQMNSPTRAQRYFERAQAIRREKTASEQGIMDFTRIMMCLYTAILDSAHKEIQTFDFSVDVLDPRTVVLFMKKEEDVILNFRKKRFEPKERYSLETCVLLMTIVVLYRIVSDRVQEVQAYE